MIKPQDILLICIIVILIIVICYCKNNKKEGFVSTEIFNVANLESISAEIDKESKEIDTIKGKFNDIIKRNKIQYYIENKDDNDKKNGTYKLFEEGDKEEDKIELGALIDINNLVKLNSDLGNKLKNIPYNRYYEETVKGAIRKRIEIINDEIIKQKQQEQLEESKLNKFPIKNIKHIDTSVMFDLKRVDGDTYKVKYINDNNNGDNSNNSNKCNNKCLTFNVDKYSDENSDYYSFEDCVDDKDDTQNLKVNNIKLEYKCYDIKSKTLDKTKTFKECNDDLHTYLKYDKDSYVKKYNDLLSPKELHININNLNNLPDDFAVITPTKQPLNESKQCLTVDNEGLSFQDCNLYEHQRFNYERDIVEEEDGE